MFHDTQPAALGPDGSRDAWAEFRVDDPAELLHLLQQLRDTSAPVMLSSPQGALLSSQLWALDAPQRQISLCADAGVAADVATRWTHTAGGSSARALYLVPSWARQCAEMLRLVVAAHGPWSNAGEPEGESNGAAR